MCGWCWDLGLLYRLFRWSAVQCSCHGAEQQAKIAVSGEEAVTPEDEARIRELPNLIANESNPERIKLLAAELERLLIIEGKWLPTATVKPKSS